MSGRLRAPSSASVMQCSSTSPSECATQPRVCCARFVNHIDHEIGYTCRAIENLLSQVLPTAVP